MSLKILFSEKIHPAATEILKSVGEIQVAEDPSEDTIVKIIGDFDAFIVRSSKVTPRMVEAGKKLKVIGRHGIGVDNIPLDAAAKQKIIVVNTPEANVISVAEHTVAAMLTLCKRFRESDSGLRSGIFDQPGSLPGLVTKLGYSTVELYGKTLGLIGVGKIGRKVANTCMNGFGMNVCGFDAFLSPEAISGMGIEPCASVEEAAAKADFISIHVPLTQDTKGLINEKMLKKMKPTAILINAARGGVVNEEDLYTALKEKTIAGAAVDVFEKEPPKKDHPFFQLDNILVTPHAAAMSDGALYRMAVDVAQGVKDVLEGKVPAYWCNKEVFLNN